MKIMRTRKEQVEFLKKCYKQIYRISRSQLSSRSREEILLSEQQDDTLLLMDSSEKIDGSVPSFLMILQGISGRLYHLKNAKIWMLVNLYNEVASAVKQRINFDFTEIAKRVKLKVNALCHTEFQVNSDQLMHLHRRNRLRRSFLGRFFRPASAVFLEKYGFFRYPETPPLVVAVRNRDLRAVDRLLFEGADINERDQYGNEAGDTALMAAISNQDLNMVYLLLSCGALVRTDSLRRVIDLGNARLLKLLLGENKKRFGLLDISYLYRAVGSIIHPMDMREESLEAVVNRRVNVVEVLLLHGVDYNMPSEGGRTILEFAKDQLAEFNRAFTSDMYQPCRKRYDVMIKRIEVSLEKNRRAVQEKRLSR